MKLDPKLDATISRWAKALQAESIDRYGMETPLEDHLISLEEFKVAILDDSMLDAVKHVRQWGEFYLDRFAVRQCSLDFIKKLHAKKLLSALVIPNSNCDMLHLAAGAGRLDVCSWIWDELTTGKRAVSIPEKSLDSALCEVLPSDIDKVVENCIERIEFASAQETAQWLLDKGADINGLSATGSTALGEIFATKSGEDCDLEYAEFLLSKGADINGAGQSGYTPLLHAAAGVVDMESIKWLLDRGADPSIRMTSRRVGRSTVEVDLGVLAFVAGKWSSLDNLLALQEWTGLDPARDAAVMQMAISREDAQMVQYLIDHGADPNELPLTEQPHLVHATIMGCVAVLRVLLASGADPNVISLEHPESPMHPLAVAAVHPRIPDDSRQTVLRVLIDAGSRPPKRLGEKSFAQVIAKAPKEIKSLINSLVAEKSIEAGFKGALEGAFGAGSPVVSAPVPTKARKSGLSL